MLLADFTLAQVQPSTNGASLKLDCRPRFLDKMGDWNTKSFINELGGTFFLDKPTEAWKFDAFPSPRGPQSNDMLDAKRTDVFTANQAEGEARRNSKRFHTSAVDELDDLEVQGAPMVCCMKPENGDVMPS